MGALRGLRVRVCGDPPVVEDCARLLAAYGAAVEQNPHPGPATVVVSGDGCRAPGAARMTAAVPACPGLPAAAPARAAAGLLATAALASTRTGAGIEVDADSAATLLLQPLVMAHWYGAPPPGRAVPTPVRDGWVAAELGSPGDAELFALLRAAEPDADAERLSGAAQEWRLPVVPYRAPAPRTGPSAAAGAASADPCADPPTDRADGAAPLAGTRIVDVTAMWAGPLCTWLLASLGASVLTVESDARPDGMRAPAGGGIYPGGIAPDGDGGRSAMFVALARGKQRARLDLRDPDDRAAFAEACSGADLRVDSLSRRARHQLALDSLVGIARPATVSIPAFPEGPEGGWVAYGTQVHAVSGLALPAGANRPIPAATAYADALGGVAAALAALVALHASARRPGLDLEAPLARAVAGMAADTDGGALLRADPGDRVAQLADGPRARFTEHRVGDALLRHPATPFPSVPGVVSAEVAG